MARPVFGPHSDQVGRMRARPCRPLWETSVAIEPRIGLLVGREWSFPPAFIERVAKKNAGVLADYIKLDATPMAQPVPYTLIIDRISHEVGFYRTFLKHATRMGTTVINNPFMWSADDKFYDATLAVQHGVAHPKTMVLPNKDYIPGISHSESLRNLAYPLDWRGVAEHIGFPCVLKDAHGGGWRDVYVCDSMEELLHHYNSSGLLTMVVQEFIKWDQYVRCMCLGREKVLPMPYDPRERRYIPDEGYLSNELEERCIRDSLTLCKALGYDMNTVEFAVKDGIPYAIDFMNPAPDMDIYSLTPSYFEWVVENMADMAIKLAKQPRIARIPGPPFP
ncbi:MAG TPA: hypothetical protein VE869_02800 [Gemmatimonas sp.]|nr:hypothetical protein [Gemmatimonas sp.]